MADPSLPYAARKRLYEAAIEASLPAIARLFLVASPTAPVPPTLKKQLGPERPLRPTDRPLTLGERKSLARTHRRDKIILMVRDPHPDVVEIDPPATRVDHATFVAKGLADRLVEHELELWRASQAQALPHLAPHE